MEEIRTGWFVSFDRDEADDVSEFLTELGYSPDAEGIKKFMLNACDGEVKIASKNAFVDAINENPELIAKGISTLGDLAGSLLNKKFFKKSK